MIDKASNERRKTGIDHVFFGLHRTLLMPLLMPLSMLMRNAMIVGAPGTGKTVMLALLAIQLIAMGHNVIILDCKGSVVTLQTLLREALNYLVNGVRYSVRVFNPLRGYPSHIYNPWLQTAWALESPEERAETLLDSFGIQGDEGTDSAFFAAVAFLLCADMNCWFPSVKNAGELLALLNDSHLFVAKGGILKDWHHSRHLAASLRQVAQSAAASGIPTSPEQAIDLMDVFTGPQPCLYYFFLSNTQNPRLTKMVARIALQQIKKCAYETQYRRSNRHTFVLADEAHDLFGPMFAAALETLREFNVSVLMFHQSRAQLITSYADFRERIENAIGFQAVLGARTPEEIDYIVNTDCEVTTYDLNWTQPTFTQRDGLLLHPLLSYQPDPWRHPQLVNVSERTVPRLSKADVLRVSADPQAGFIRGFLNEGLWAFDASWVPFRWFHHLTPQEHVQFKKAYPSPLPGQQYFNTASPAPGPAKPKDIKTDLSTDALTAALRQLGMAHRKKHDLD
jgi:hypothetical protein